MVLGGKKETLVPLSNVAVASGTEKLELLPGMRVVSVLSENLLEPDSVMRKLRGGCKVGGWVWEAFKEERSERSVGVGPEESELAEKLAYGGWVGKIEREKNVSGEWTDFSVKNGFAMFVLHPGWPRRGVARGGGERGVERSTGAVVLWVEEERGVEGMTFASEFGVRETSEGDLWYHITFGRRRRDDFGGGKQVEVNCVGQAIRAKVLVERFNAGERIDLVLLVGTLFEVVRSRWGWRELGATGVEHAQDGKVGAWIWQFVIKGTLSGRGSMCVSECRRVGGSVGCRAPRPLALGVRTHWGESECKRRWLKQDKASA
jgi:hypothetical protein